MSSYIALSAVRVATKVLCAALCTAILIRRIPASPQVSWPRVYSFYWFRALGFGALGFKGLVVKGSRVEGFRGLGFGVSLWLVQFGAWGSRLLVSGI